MGNIGAQNKNSGARKLRTRTGGVDGVNFSESGRTPCVDAEASLASEKRFLPKALRDRSTLRSPAPFRVAVADIRRRCEAFKRNPPHRGK